MGLWFYDDVPGWALLDYPDYPHLERQFQAFEMPWLLERIHTALWMVLG